MSFDTFGIVRNRSKMARDVGSHSALSSLYMLETQQNLLMSKRQQDVAYAAIDIWPGRMGISMCGQPVNQIRTFRIHTS